MKTLNQFKPIEYKKIVPEFFEMPYTIIENGIKIRRLRNTTEMCAELLFLEIKVNQRHFFFQNPNAFEKFLI